MRNVFLGLAASLALFAGAQETGKTVTFTANDEWKTVEWNPYEMRKGSALDFSTLLPPVKPVRISGENFLYADGSGGKVFFNGVGVPHGLPFLPKEQAEQLTDMIAACGFNAVRFHLYPDFLIKADPDAASWGSGKSTAELDPAKLDQFHYFMYCLGKKGVYYTMPLASWGYLKEDYISDVPEYKGEKIRTELFMLYGISPQAKQYLRDLARNLLTSVNPYTGKRVMDDPALVTLESGNENSPYAPLPTRPQRVAVYRRAYLERMKEQGKTPTEQEIEEALPKFVMELHEAAYLDFKAYLRGLGVKQPITDLGFRANMIYSIHRSNPEVDYVDIHAYWNLYRKHDTNRVKRKEGPYILRHNNPFANKWDSTAGAAAGRILGKPFFVGEYNVSYPSPHSAMMPPVEAATALSQNWSGIFFYCLAPFPQHAFGPKLAPTNHVQSMNPMMMFSTRIAGKLLLRQEIEPFPVTIPLVLTPEFLYSQLDLAGGPTYPKLYRDLSLRTRIGTVVWNENTELGAYSAVAVPDEMKEIPAKLKAANPIPVNKSMFSHLKQFLPGFKPQLVLGTNKRIVTDSAGKSGKILTPASECLFFPAELAEQTGKFLTVRENKGEGLCFAGSLDGKTLANSKRLIAFYITDLRNSGTTLEYTKDGVLVHEIGETPFLLRQGEVEFLLQSENSALPKVWALKYDGSRKKELTVAKAPGGYAFKAAAVTAPDAYFAYEISWE